MEGYDPGDGTPKGFFVGLAARTLRDSCAPEWVAREKTPAFNTFEAMPCGLSARDRASREGQVVIAASRRVNRSLIGALGRKTGGKRWSGEVAITLSRSYGETENMPKKTTALVLPDWLDAELWREFLAHRKTLKKPMTDYAQSLAFKLLERFKTAGHDPRAVIEQSIFNGWQGLFEPRAIEISAAPRAGSVHADTLRAKTQADDERNASIDPAERARNARLARERLGLRTH